MILLEIKLLADTSLQSGTNSDISTGVNLRWYFFTREIEHSEKFI